LLSSSETLKSLLLKMGRRRRLICLSEPEHLAERLDGLAVVLAGLL